MPTVLYVLSAVTVALAVYFAALGIAQPEVVPQWWEWLFVGAFLVNALLAYELARLTAKREGAAGSQSEGGNTEQQLALAIYHAYYCQRCAEFLLAAEGQLPRPIGLMNLEDAAVVILSCPFVAAQVARGLRLHVYWQPPGRLRKPRMLVGIAQVEHIQESGLLHAKVLDIANKDPLLVAVEPLHGQIGYTALAEGTWTTELELPTMPQVDVQRRG